MRERGKRRQGFAEHHGATRVRLRVARGRGTDVGMSPRMSSRPSAKPAPISTPQTFLLCALVMPGQASKNVTVAAGGSAFDSLVSALSRADEPAPGPGTVCAAFADLSQVVLAKSGAGVYQVSIPTDGCGHYERSALTALRDARVVG